MTQSTVAPFEAEWVHLQYPQQQAFREVYGFAGQSGVVNLEGVRYRPPGARARTLLVYMHPASTLQLLPMPRALAARGLHVLCAASRYARNDSALILENVLLDLAAYLRHAKERWGYEKIVLIGWSGGGSLMLYYQSQAERPSLIHTPAGDPCPLAEAQLLPADGMILQAAHVSRAELLADWIDPSVLDENDPDHRDPALDLYHPQRTPPYDASFLASYRAAQRARIARKTAWVMETLQTLRRRGGKEMERAFVTHRTMADPRFFDGCIDPNDRTLGTCYLGDPETVNSGPVGLARFCTLRAWMSQWSPLSHADGERCARAVTVPLLAIEHSADDAVPQPHTRRLFEAAASADKTMHLLRGATHYLAGQPQLLEQAVALCCEWLAARGLLD